MKKDLAIQFLLLAVFTGGCTTMTLEDRYRASLDSYTQMLPEVVADEDRAEKLRETGNDLFQTLRAEAGTLTSLTERVHALSRDYNASREDLVKALADLDRHRQKVLYRILESRRDVVSLTTEEEWAALVSRESTLLSVMQDELDGR